jgi:hypothetical protein
MRWRRSADTPEPADRTCTSGLRRLGNRLFSPIRYRTRKLGISAPCRSQHTSGGVETGFWG